MNGGEADSLVGLADEEVEMAAVVGQWEGGMVVVVVAVDHFLPWEVEETFRAHQVNMEFRANMVRDKKRNFVYFFLFCGRLLDMIRAVPETEAILSVGR